MPGIGLPVAWRVVEDTPGKAAQCSAVAPSCHCSLLSCITFPSREQIPQGPVTLPFGDGGDMINPTTGLIPFDQVRMVR